MIQRRVAKSIDHRIRNTQYGLRKFRSTSQPTRITRRAQELREISHEPLYMLFLDWKIAFDRVDHTALIESLRRIGVPPHMVDVIPSIYAAPSFYAVSSTGPEHRGSCSDRGVPSAHTSSTLYLRSSCMTLIEKSNPNTPPPMGGRSDIPVTM